MSRAATRASIRATRYSQLSLIVHDVGAAVIIEFRAKKRNRSCFRARYKMSDSEEEIFLSSSASKYYLPQDRKRKYGTHSINTERNSDPDH